METDKSRGDYIDPNAGKVPFGTLGQKWLASRGVDPASMIRYESVYRLHVEPTFGRRQVRTIKPSDIQVWLADLGRRFSTALVNSAFLVLQGILDLAVADEEIKKSPAKDRTVKAPGQDIQAIETAWHDDLVHAVIDGHPDRYRTIPVVGAACGLRLGELFAIDPDDIDRKEQVIRVRRQIKKLGRHLVYALPKNDRERVVPLAGWAARAIDLHITKHPPQAHTLPWETIDGQPRTHTLLFCWTDDIPIRARNYSETIWKPALTHAKIIPPPVKDTRGRARYATTGHEGMHQLRHYFASVMLTDGVTIRELAEFLGHHDPAFTMRVYSRMQPGSHDRARNAMDQRMFRPRAVS